MSSLGSLIQARIVDCTKVNRKTVESGGLEVAQVWVSSLGSLIRARIVDCTKVDRETLAVNRKP